MKLELNQIKFYLFILLKKLLNIHFNFLNGDWGFGIGDW